MNLIRDLSERSWAKAHEFTSREAFVDWLTSSIEKLVAGERQKAKDRDRTLVGSVVYSVGGTVEGQPTSSINFLQRIRKLRHIEDLVMKLDNVPRRAEEPTDDDEVWADQLIPKEILDELRAAIRGTTTKSQTGGP